MRGSSRSTRDRLLDVLDAIDKAQTAVGDRSQEAFSEDWLHQFAAERAIEIISEASRHIPDDLKATAPDIPWRDVADIGNFLRHVYEGTDPEIVWTVVKFRLAALEQAIRGMLERLNHQS